VRICSFLPSATEIVYALGLGDSLHGVSHECDYPEEARAKPRVVTSRIDSDRLGSAEIDRLVADLMSRGEPLYEVDALALEHARPDLVITQQLCEVCAVSLDDVEAAVARLPNAPRVISLDPHGVDDVLADVVRVGRAAGAEEKAEEVAAAGRERLERVRAAVAKSGTPPRVACVEWLDPLIVAGHWIPEMVQLAGGIDGMAQPGTPSRRIEIDELIGYNPDVVILMPCGMDVPRTIHDFSQLGDLDRWRTISAVKQGNVYAVDAGGLFSRSGPRLVDGVEMLAKMIHPQVFTESLPEKSAKRLETLPVSPA
jgi:iron complex transport system substrate-binding protein